MKKLLALLALTLPALAAGKPEAAVKYRQSVMKSMGAQMTAMSLIVKGEVAHRERLAGHAEALHAVSRDLEALFPVGSGSDKVRTAAKPEIWKRWTELLAAAAALERESAKLSQLAAGRDARAFDAQFEKVSAACANCHKPFRVRDTE